MTANDLAALTLLDEIGKNTGLLSEMSRKQMFNQLHYSDVSNTLVNLKKKNNRLLTLAQAYHEGRDILMECLEMKGMEE